MAKRNELIGLFKSFDQFLRFQGAVKRRFMACIYEIFRKQIAKRINEHCIRSIPLYDFQNKLLHLLNIPERIDSLKSEEDKIISYAEKSLKGLHNLLGSGEVLLNPIDWHSDFKSGSKWPPGKFFKNYLQEEIDSFSDVKVPRELSRCHHLLKMGLAFKISKNEKYAKACIDQIEDWIDENPLMFSINWGCTMDVAIRAVNWIWTLSLISEYHKQNPTVLRKIQGSLYQHGWYIWRFPEKEIFYSSNHYLSDISGLIHLGLLFNGMKEPKRWLEKGKIELFREIRLQILPTGMSYERSTSYNRLVLELILVPVLLLKSNGHEIPQDIWFRLEKMFEFIMYSLKPDGTTPIIGDQDNGRLLPLGNESVNDFRYLMSLGTVLFNRSDFKTFGNGFNSYCALLGGSEAITKWGYIAAIDLSLKSKAFPDAGIFILRDRDNYLLFNATGKGMYPELETGTHTHSDLLSFELFTYGKSFLIDPGSYMYTADAEMRMLFRSTKMHNTITVDGESQNIIKKEVLWDFSRDAIPEVTKWESDSDHDIIIAGHNGYSRLSEPVQHERSVMFDKVPEKWIVKDTLLGCGYHMFEWHFHFDTGIDFRINGNVVETICKDGKNISLTFDKVSGIELKRESGLVSKSYGIKEEGFVLVAILKRSVPFEFTIVIQKKTTENETDIQHS